MIHLSPSLPLLLIIYIILLIWANTIFYPVLFCGMFLVLLQAEMRNERQRLTDKVSQEQRRYAETKRETQKLVRLWCARCHEDATYAASVTLE